MVFLVAGSFEMLWRALIVLIALQLHYSMSAAAAEPAAILGRGASQQTNDDDAETIAVAEIFAQLTEEEKEDAAKSSSYRYLKAARCSKDERDRHARAMIERYVRTEHKLRTKQSQWTDRALAKIRSTIEYRRDAGVDDVRTCFDRDKRHSDLHRKIRERLEGRYASKGSVIRGYGKKGQALFLNYPRCETKWDEETFVEGNIYMLERALAATERRTDGKVTKILNFYDYNGYAMKNSPPPLLIARLLGDLRDHWPDRLEGVYIVDSPWIFRTFWGIIKHFIDPVTFDLVHFVTGEAQKEILKGMIDEEHAAPFMYEGEKAEGEADMKKFFYEIPTDKVYDE